MSYINNKDLSWLYSSANYNTGQQIMVMTLMTNISQHWPLNKQYFWLSHKKFNNSLGNHIDRLQIKLIKLQITLILLG